MVSKTHSKTDLLVKIEQDIRKNMTCPLKAAAQNLVFGKGSPNAPILFIGEAPGANEDKQGLPFVGAAGKNLDKLLNSINLTLDQCYVANILKYRPPKNRPPQFDEMRRHVPYLIQQINIIQPKIIVTLGNFATKFALSNFNVDVFEKTSKKIHGVSLIHGKDYPITINKTTFIVIPLYHPAASIHNVKIKQVLLDDFQLIKAFLDK